MTKPICPSIPTADLIVRKSQVTLDLVSKDVEGATFQKMIKSTESGQIQYLIFTFCVLSKVRVYENLKNVFQETLKRSSIFHQVGHKAPDTVENQSEIVINLSSKNVKDAFFESMISHKNESGITSLTFTFTCLSMDSIYEEIDSIHEELAPPQNPPPIPSLATHPAKRAVSNPLYDPLNKRKNVLRKIRQFLNKLFVIKSLSVPQDRYGQHAFDSTKSQDFNGGLLNISCDEDPIYEKIEDFRKRTSSK